jgi:hypothetical protein
MRSGSKLCPSAAAAADREGVGRPHADCLTPSFKLPFQLDSTIEMIGILRGDGHHVCQKDDWLSRRKAVFRVLGCFAFLDLIYFAVFISVVSDEEQQHEGSHFSRRFWYAAG